MTDNLNRELRLYMRVIAACAVIVTVVAISPLGMDLMTTIDRAYSAYQSRKIDRSLYKNCLDFKSRLGKPARDCEVMNPDRVNPEDAPIEIILKPRD